MKISIITVSYNSEKTIEDTIKSVLNQKYKNYEHIIIDGASTDNTIKIVNKYRDKYNNNLILVSEKDKGIYDAMNKGIKLATGEIIGLLNSDDVYSTDKTLEKIATSLKDKQYSGVYGDLLYLDSKTLSIPKRKWISGKGKIRFGFVPAHPTLYLRREVYKKIGLYSLKYRIVSDYDFMIRLCTDKQYKLKYINEYLIHMRLGGTSSDGIKGYYKNMKEAYRVLKNNKIKFAWFTIFIRIIKTYYQMITSRFVKLSKN